MPATPAVKQTDQQRLFIERHAWMFAAALIFCGIVTQVKVVPSGFERNDFAHYYLAARILLSGENPYTVPLEPLCEAYGFEYDQRIPYGANPPLLIRAFTLLAWMPPQLAFGVWMAIELGLLCVLLECTRRIVGWQSNQAAWWLFVGLVLSSTSLQAHTYYSQVQLLVAAVLAVAFAARLKGQHWLACGLVALAAGFKIYPAVLLPWFILFDAKANKERCYRAGVVAGVLMLILAVTGAPAWISFVREGLPVIQSNMTVTSRTNYSLQALLLNALPGTLGLFGITQADSIADAVAKLISPIIILATYLLLWRRQLSNSAAFCLLTVVMILCSPVAWSHYMVLMVLPAAILFRTAAAGESGPFECGTRSAELGIRNSESSGREDANIGLRNLIYLVAVLSLMPDLDGSFFSRSGHALAWAIHYYPLYALAAAAILFVRLPEFAPRRRNTEAWQAKRTGATAGLPAVFP